MKKLLSVLLATVLLLMMIPFSALSISAGGVTPDYVKSQLDSFKSNATYKPGNTPPSSLYRSGTSGCFGFVDLLCRKIFGHNLASQKSAMELYTTNFKKIGSTLSKSAGNLSESSLKSLLSNAKTGDVVQMDYTTYSGEDSRHTMMVYSVSSQGVVFYHAGSSKIYFGQSSGSQPLWGTTGSVLTWANLYKCLRGNDDGISMYRSTTVSDSHTHTYSNACDTTCNICGASRTVNDHVWNTNICGNSYCLNCDTYRVTFHTYSNACDTTCNTCGAVRAVNGHVYSNACDATCNTCGATRTLNYIYEGTETRANVNVGGQQVDFVFVPTKTQDYTFYSGSTVDTYGYILDQNGNELARNDDGGEDRNFSVTYYMTAGTKYILRAVYYHSSTVGSFPVNVIHNHTYTNACDVSCNTCGTNREVAEHQWEDGICSVCGGESPTKVAIIDQPQTTYTKMGAIAKVTVEATGEGLKYQWYFKKTGATKYNKSSNTTSVYETKMSSASKNRMVYCVVTDKYGNTIKSDTKTLREAVSITTQPKTTYTKKGATTKVTVKASGDGLKYQWYFKKAGATKYSKSSNTTSVYDTKMSSASKNRMVYCVVTDKYGNKVKSDTKTLREAVSITTQPKTVTVKKNTTAKVSVKASGDGLKYTWYVKNAGSTKYVKSSITKSTYSVKMTAKAKNRLVYCVVTDKYGKTVKTVTVKLKMK